MSQVRITIDVQVVIEKGDIAAMTQENQVLHGHVEVDGCHMHATLVKVREDEKTSTLEPVADPDGYFEQMQSYYSGKYATLKLPYLEGDWAMFIFPYAD